ncbi:RNA polymerase factor sigma-54 [Laribacter hongkongensis]|uniref:RNA polymerase factor sigma-54 n=1 Tax=Laribacter hongkongensis TaxID=168471 RepID=UPI001EFEB7A1|nr:RNA polymerase factor sigma-54 [Laribacter hongkongensis]MCG9063893.1 RNA polymerase factor sigma-54 [Laribacter hongkongensis]
MKQSLQLKLSQQLTLTPQLQQSIKLLQLSTLDLQQEVEQFLADNPLLERVEDGEHDDSANGADEPAELAPAEHAGSDDPREHDDSARDLDTLNDWSSSGIRGSDEDDDWDPHANLIRPQSLREHLLAQLAEVPLSARDRAVATFLVEEIDDDGYLPASLESLAEQLPASLEVELDELTIALRLIQQFEPAGVGARDLTESLLLQLRARSGTDECTLACTIVRDHLQLLANRDFTRLRRATSADDEALRQAQALIASLNPRPAAGFASGDTHYVMADVIVRRDRQGIWQAHLNPASQPRLKVNQMYANLLGRCRGEGGELSGRLQEAKWLIRNIEQRADTILRVSSVIVERQQGFFEQGELLMKPMVLRDVAEELGLHESTISRVTSNKYLLCPRGIFELKYFFGSALDTDSGEECSATAIKARIRRLIAEEDARKPLSDNTIADLLGEEGIQVARRTVAKYREALLIPPASQRKMI